MTGEVWSVADAKARLSEVLRRAREEGPQRIGSQRPCIVIAEEEWQRLRASTRPPPPPHMGRWLIEQLRGAGELELPERRAPDRATPPLGLEDV